jgi:hypothetical protein
VGGYDTSSEITQTLQRNAVNTYGPPNYWLRYYQPSPCATKIQAHPIDECRAIWDSGAKHLSPISEPRQTNLNNGSAQGQADAQSFVSAMIDVWATVGPLKFPVNQTLYCFLGQEPSTQLGADYWQAWASYLNSYSFNQHLPFFACLYCVPGQGNSCNVINNSSATCWIVWTPQHQHCAGQIDNPPAWDAISCSGVPTHLWQFADGGCNLSVNVDKDTSDINFPNFCFYLDARP